MPSASRAPPAPWQRDVTLRIWALEDFPGSLVVKTLHLQCKERGFIPGQETKSLQLCLTLRPCGPPGSLVHGILQARILEWVTISFSRGSSHPRD